jgi:tetratricopeptide (TPR) repeat protein
MNRPRSTRDTLNPEGSGFGMRSVAVRAGLLSLAFGVCAGYVASAQTPSTATQSATQLLLDKAHNLEVRGRMDMAAQTWQQVLLADPKNVDALGGLARAAKLAGNSALAGVYLDRLRALNPNDPNIARVQTMMTQQSQSAQLAQAGKLAETGQYAQAMAIYRQVFGAQPPAGDWALAYYETESATDDGRAHAIAGLRGLMARYPQDSRYQIALGRILTYTPKTRAEGRRLLERYPSDTQAQEALRQSLVWDAQNPASAAEIRAYLLKHNDAQLATALKNQPKRPVAPAPRTPDEVAEAARNRTLGVQIEAAYKALNARHIEEAEGRFKEILADEPNSGRALAGMGYVRMQQSNFGGAISFLEQAKQDGAIDPGIDTALASARFYFVMSEGEVALDQNDLTTAEKKYQAALAMRPGSPEALEGLGGTLMKAQQPDVAVQVFEQYAKVKPAAPAAWRGLFMAKFNSGNAAGALASDRAIPPAVHAELMRDPDFLRVLASAYSAAGRDADAQRVLRAALDLPFPSGARGVKVETLLQYAGLLQQANRLDQAAGLFRQALATDPANTQAWEGLVRVEHAMNQDGQAIQTLESMPPANYDLAMRDPGFEQTVAAAYQGQNKLDIAQSILEKAIAQQTTAGQKPSVAVETQLAGLYLAQNNARQAYPIYRQILSGNPERTDAWKGLLSTLHSSGRDQEALAEVQQIPAEVRRTLENDVDYLQTMGNVYSSLGQPRQSMVFMNRIQQHYAAQHAVAPADIDIQNAYLLFNGQNDTGLYRQLMILGGRQDLTDEQRRTVQTIWSLWASRRANAAAAAGNNKRALAILNAAARAFPDNPGVLKALASGYARAGMPKQAVLIFKAQDMTSASAADYKAAVGAALAANDVKSAETWLRFGLDQYPKDAQMLGLAAKFEQARGDSGRAAEYYRASLAAMPAPDPGAELANELSRPMPSSANRLPNATQSQDLASLLGPGAASDNAPAADNPEPARPYLPTYANAYGTPPVEVGPLAAPQAAQQGYSSAVPSYMTNPDSQSRYQAVTRPSYPSAYQPKQPTKGRSPSPSQPRSPTLKDYVPPSEQPAGGYAIPLENQPAQPPVQPVQPSQPPNSSLDPTQLSPDAYSLNEQAYRQHQIQRLTQQAQGQTPYVFESPSQSASQTQLQSQGPLSYAPVQSQNPTGNSAESGQPGVVYGPYVPYVPPSPVPVQLGDATPHSLPPQREVTDVLPTARYVPNVRTKRKTSSSHPDIAAAEAASARRRQSNPNLGMTGQSNPPPDEPVTPPAQEAQYTLQPPQAQVPQYPQPPRESASQPFENPGQQYPQPGVRPSAKRRTTTSSRIQRSTSIADQPGMLYPGVAQPLTYQPSPAIGPAAPLGTPPTDADLVARMVPPLRGYDPSAGGAAPPLTPREQTERDLDTLESSYSAWIGGTGFARYRSGTVGFDRLTDLEASFEASVVAAKKARFTVVARPVFLSNGLVDTATLSAITGTVPVIGTLPGNATATPAQQYASGVGGELQMTTSNLGIALGYTPYEFLVSNITGRFTWRPGGGHFTLFGDRDSVKETQLSYAGLRDPGSATAFFPGNIWGGVVSSGGGARIDLGNERSGFYLSADGADITGYHVLENRKYEGTMGAYFRVKVIPRYGSLNVGATFFGMHYDHNELGLTYGQGGYFSPQSYFLAALPVSYTGHYKSDVHYSIAGSVGLQTFQSQSAPYYPLDRGTETDSGNPTFPSNSNTGLNYAVNSEGSYRIADHWYVGGFLSGNNTNNYNTVTGGFFVRYLFKPQYPTDDYPTGLFPVDGFRPLRVP